MAARNWTIERQRYLMRQRGVEDVRGASSVMAVLLPREPRRRPLSKAELRAQAEAALTSYSGTVTKIPAGKRNL
jgi:hypothetical protein